MVSPITTPAWTMLFSTAAAVVTDGGGVLSHAAIVAREHGIPAVIGAPGATSTIADGQLVTVDGTTGLVTVAH
jgi:pyruvate,water dikinase